jgi:oxygen-independent coproporphyrinogen-3 oxidase
MLLYIHIPFCKQKCHYCTFFSVPIFPELLEIYLQGLKKEIVLRAKELNYPSVSSVYVGGGTPTLLPPSVLEKIFNWLHKNFSFQQYVEVTIEANPETINGENLFALKKMGITRVSLGVQSLNDADLKFLGRKHTAKEAISVYYMLRDAGFNNINLDFIWGLPGHTPGRWIKTLRKAIKLKPEHFSCYALTIEPGSKLARNKDKFNFPDEDMLGQIYVYGAELLNAAGYLQYEISNFARMGYFCLHNQGYWERQDFLGLGPSAVSTIGNRRWQNPANIKDYQQVITQKMQGLDYETLDKKKKINEFIMLSLRTTKGLSLKTYRKMTGKDFLKEHARLIQLLYKNKLLKASNGHLRLTKTGMLVSNTIIERFMED